MNLKNELYIAAGNGNIICVKLMLKLGADVGAWDNYTLLWAVESGHKDVCKVLLEHGADIDNALKYVNNYRAKNYYNQIKEFINSIDLSTNLG